MSNIASGILGLGQRAAPAKGQGGIAGLTDGEDFASAIASLTGQGGGHERKGAAHARIAGQRPAEAEGGAESGAARLKTGRTASLRLSVAGGHEAGFKPDRPLAEDVFGKAVTTDGKDAAPQEAGEEPTADRPAETPPVQKAAETDVGNLLALLAARAAPQEAGTARDAGRKTGEAETTGKLRASAAGKTDAAAAHAGAEAPAGGERPASQTDQLFRLVRQDGKGREVDLRISADGEKAAAKDANPTGPKGETVTVVDARRYIGLAQGGNAGAVTAAISQDPQWAASLSATRELMHAPAGSTGGVVNTLKIQMSPVELGLVTATLRLHGDELVVSLQVETGEAYRQLSDDQDSIVRALRGQGFAVDQVSVQLAPVDRGSAAQQQGDGQFQQQFSGEPQPRDGQDGRRNGGQGGSGNVAGEGASHDGSGADGASGNQPPRAGGVYL